MRRLRMNQTVWDVIISLASSAISGLVIGIILVQFIEPRLSLPDLEATATGPRPLVEADGTVHLRFTVRNNGNYIARSCLGYYERRSLQSAQSDQQGRVTGPLEPQVPQPIAGGGSLEWNNSFLSSVVGHSEVAVYVSCDNGTSNRVPYQFP